jgi:DHA1 family bicyclomycin/chloramphenicol resistance-like MFS transporter
LHAWFGWRSVFVFLSLFAFCLWLWCFLKLPETLDKCQRQSMHPLYLARTYKKVLSRGAFLAACAAVSLNFNGFFVYVTSAPVFLLQHLNLKETQFLWLFGPATAGMMVGSWFASRFAGTFSHKKSVGIGFLIMTLAALANIGINSLMAPRIPWAVAPFFFYTIGMTIAMPSLILLALDLFPAQRGLASSCQGFIQTATNSLTAALIAPAVNPSSLRLATSQILFVLAGIVAALLFFSSSLQKPKSIRLPEVGS